VRLSASTTYGGPTRKSILKDQRELDQLPGEIEAPESDIQAIQQYIAAADFYTQEQQLVQAKLRELTDKKALLESRVERWSELEESNAAFANRRNAP
jgi:ATP-binding cassette subfamily F protein uup